MDKNVSYAIASVFTFSGFPPQLWVSIKLILFVDEKMSSGTRFSGDGRRVRLLSLTIRLVRLLTNETVNLILQNKIENGNNPIFEIQIYNDYVIFIRFFFAKLCTSGNNTR